MRRAEKIEPCEGEQKIMAVYAEDRVDRETLTGNLDFATKAAKEVNKECIGIPAMRIHKN